MVFVLRLLPESPREAFALWQMTAEDFQPVLGVLLDGQSGAGWVVTAGSPSKPRWLWVLSQSPSRPGQGASPTMGTLAFAPAASCGLQWALWGLTDASLCPCSRQKVPDLFQP